MTIPGPVVKDSANTRVLLIFGTGIAVALFVLVAIIGLILLPRSNGVDSHLKDLKGTDPDTRAAAVVYFAEAEPTDGKREAVTSSLQRLLFEGDPDGKAQPDMVVRAYLHWADRDNVPDLIRYVDNPTVPSRDVNRTSLAMQKLGELQDGRGAEVLAKQLPNADLHDAAVSSLKLMGPEGTFAVIDYAFDDDPNTRQRANDVLAAYHTRPDAIAEAAMTRLRLPTAESKRHAAYWFAENPPVNDEQKAEVSKLLTSLLDDLSPRTNGAALRALQLWATKDSLQSLVAFASRQAKLPSGSEARKNDGPLLKVLSQFTDATAAEAMASLLLDPEQRDKAFQALLKLGPVAGPATLQYFNHPDPAIHKEARRLAKALEIPDQRQLEQTLADVADARKARSRTALQYLASRRPEDPFRNKVSPALNAALVDSDPGIREEATNAVALWATNENTATLVKVLAGFQVRSQEDFARIEKVSQALIAIGPTVEDAVAPLLQAPERAVRAISCHILAEVGTAKSTKLLQESAEKYYVDQPFCREVNAAMQKIAERK
jgi:hypothetical protein